MLRINNKLDEISCFNLREWKYTFYDNKRKLKYCHYVLKDNEETNKKLYTEIEINKQFYVNVRILVRALYDNQGVKK